MDTEAPHWVALNGLILRIVVLCSVNRKPGFVAVDLEDAPLHLMERGVPRSDSHVDYLYTGEKTLARMRAQQRSVIFMAIPRRCIPGPPS